MHARVHITLLICQHRQEILQGLTLGVELLSINGCQKRGSVFCRVKLPDCLSNPKTHGQDQLYCLLSPLFILIDIKRMGF